MKERLGSLALFVLLAILHTWPLATNPGRLSRNDTADTIHHEWILAWDAHQLASDPGRLFDANIFYPERDTLAYSDHLLPQAVMGAPRPEGATCRSSGYGMLAISRPRTRRRCPCRRSR